MKKKEEIEIIIKKNGKVVFSDKVTYCFISQNREEVARWKSIYEPHIEWIHEKIDTDVLIRATKHLPIRKKEFV